MSELVQLSDLVRRITAPNGGPMTGPGTNTYLVGNSAVAVIDPGPAVDSHMDAVLAAAGDRIKWIYVTHTHPDHSPAANRLAKATGAELRGMVLSPDDGHQDRSFTSARNPQDGEVFTAEEFSLQAIFTPGHVGNHFCYLLQEEGMLFAGDHIMENTTIVIVPPSGDMAAYLDSLRYLKQFSINVIAPGHGNLIENPMAEVDRLVAHRLRREQQIIELLRELGESSLERLLPIAYRETDKRLHQVAKYSLWAHLLKLENDGVVKKTIEKHWAFGEEHWVLIDNNEG